jgi:hypothetical protein
LAENKNDVTKGVLFGIGSCFVTLMMAILITGLTTTVFIDTTKCSSMSRALPVLWGAIAGVFLASVVAVRVFSRKIVQSTTNRRIFVAVYGVVMLVSYILLAFVLLVLFNC